MKWTTVLLAALVLVIASPGPVRAQKAGPEALQPLVGEYVLVDRKIAVERRDAGIDKVVDELNFFIRGIARSRLSDGNPIPKTLRIERDGSKMTVTWDGQPSMAVLDGKAVTVEGTSGDPLQMTLKQSGEHLKQRFVGEQGGKENFFRRTKNGAVVTVRIFSERLPADVVYQLKFRRK